MLLLRHNHQIAGMTLVIVNGMVVGGMLVFSQLSKWIQLDSFASVQSIGIAFIRLNLHNWLGWIFLVYSVVVSEWLAAVTI